MKTDEIELTGEAIEGYNYKCTNYLAQIRYEVNLKEKKSWREK